MDHTKVNEVELEYEVTGTGEPILLIDPALPDAELPFLAQRTLIDRFELIRYHKRGWAGSTHTPPPVSIEDHARDAAGLLEAIGKRPAHIVGHSSGGVIAIQLALDAPELVHSLVLLEPSPMVTPSAPGFLEATGPVLAAYEAGDPEGAVAMFLSAVSGLDWDTCREVVDRNAPGAVAQAVKDADTLFGIELPSLAVWKPDAADMATISQPVLSVVGAKTQPLWIEIAAQLRVWFPHAEDLVIDDAGHLLPVQQPEAVASGASDFLTRHPMS